MADKVLIGCPTSKHKEYALLEYIDGLRKIKYRPAEILLVDNSNDMTYFKTLQDLALNAVRGPWIDETRARIAASRNILRQKVLDEDYDYLLSLEQDVIPPPDVIEKLLEHKKKIVSGVYFAKYPMLGEKVIPLAFKEQKKEDKIKLVPLTEDEVFMGPRLQKVIATGLGCVLIHKDVLKKISFRVEPMTFDDQPFFYDAHRLGFEAFVDTSVKCKHLVSGSPVQWEMKKKEDFNTQDQA